MGYNVLSGSVSNVYNIQASGTFTGSFGGDGTNLENVTQFDLYGETAGGVIPYYKSVTGETHLEGDSTFTFNPNTDTLFISNLSASAGINLSGIAAGTATTSSYLALNSNGNIVLTSSSGGGSDVEGASFSAAGASLSGYVTFKRIQVSSSVTLTGNEYYIGISASSNIIITLPPMLFAGDVNGGRTYVLKDEIGTADTHTIEINANTGQSIDGRSAVFLESPYASISLYYDGANKFLIF